MIADWAHIYICYKGKCLMNFYASRLKQYCTVREIFKFFWRHYRQKIDFMWHISNQRNIRLAWNFYCTYISSQYTSHTKLRPNEWNFAALTNTTKYRTKLAFFGILCTDISQERIMFKSWNFGYREISLSTHYDRKFSSLHSSYASGDLDQNSDFIQNRSFRRVRSRAKRGL